jgi:hypothetical protein
VVALIGVHGYNETRFNLGELRASAEPLLARARQISDRARSEYEDLALATLAPSPLNGPYYRLDDKLNEAETIEQPADGLVTADGAIVHAFEFENAAKPEFVAASDTTPPEVEGGMLKVQGDKVHFTNSTEMAVPREQIGDIVIRARDRTHLDDPGMVEG